MNSKLVNNNLSLRSSLRGLLVCLACLVFIDCLVVLLHEADIFLVCLVFCVLLVCLVVRVLLVFLVCLVVCVLLAFLVCLAFLVVLLQETGVRVFLVVRLASVAFQGLCLVLCLLVYLFCLLRCCFGFGRGSSYLSLVVEFLGNIVKFRYIGLRVLLLLLFRGLFRRLLYLRLCQLCHRFWSHRCWNC